jgi:branched-chain amino acid transport system permease protein
MTALPVRWARRGWGFVRNEVLVLPSRVLVVAFALALLLLPVVTRDPYVLRIVILASIFAIFAASWDLLSGYSGQVSLGQALYFGAGAYGSALLNHHLGWTPWVTVPLGALAGMAAGTSAGVPCLRLRGSYLSLATLAFPLIVVGALFALPSLSGGELGISGLQPLLRSRVAFYYLAVVVMLVLVLAMWLVGDSNFGLLLHAIREDEVAARAAGIDTPRHRMLAFALSGLFGGVAGALYAHFVKVAGPSTLEVALSFQAVIWGVFGGVATIYGPVAGVFLLYPLTELLALVPWVGEHRLLFFAVVVLVVLRGMPQGVAHWFRDKVERECRRCKARSVATRSTCRICAADLR